jgi:tetratricopeptide (TPR) repeat protein
VAAIGVATVALGTFWFTRQVGDPKLDREACLNFAGEAAIAACDRAIASDNFTGTDAAALFTARGYHRQVKNDQAGALLDYGEAIRLDPSLVAPRNNRGNIYRDQGDYDRAIADYTEALALNPKLSDPLASRGWIFQQKGDLDRAKQDFSRALALNPDPALRQKLEAALGGVEKFDPDYQACDSGSGAAAMAACDRAIGSGKFGGRSLAFLFNDRGYLRMVAGKLDEALIDLNNAVELDPSGPYQYWNRAEIYRFRGDLQRAAADYRKALELGPRKEDRQKIEAALNAVTAKRDPAVITDPSVFSGVSSGDIGASTSTGQHIEPPPPPATEPSSDSSR